MTNEWVILQYDQTFFKGHRKRSISRTAQTAAGSVSGHSHEDLIAVVLVFLAANIQVDGKR